MSSLTHTGSVCGNPHGLLLLSRLKRSPWGKICFWGIGSVLCWFLTIAKETVNGTSDSCCSAKQEQDTHKDMKNMILRRQCQDYCWLCNKMPPIMIEIKDRIFEHRENRNLIIMEARSLCLCVCHFSKWLIMAVMLSDWLSGFVCELKLMARFFSPKIPDTCQALPTIETRDRILNQFIWAGEFKQFRGRVCNFERLIGPKQKMRKTSHNSGSHVHHILRR